MAKLIINSPKYGRFEVLYDDKYEAMVNEHIWHVKPEYRTTNCYYVMTNIWKGEKRTGISLHRFLHPEWKEIDHINGSPLDNRDCNLRETIHSLNTKNKIKRAMATSQYKGIHKRLCGKNRRVRWYAKICFNYQNYHLGIFDDEKSAALAYDKAAKELFGDYAQLNFKEKK